MLATGLFWWVPPHPVANSRESAAHLLGEHLLPRGGTLRSATPTTRTMRGDYAPVDVLVVVHEPSWPATVEAIVAAAADTVAVDVVVDDTTRRSVYRRLTDAGGCVGFVNTPRDTPWIRDYGPLQVDADGTTEWVDLTYDSKRALDDNMPSTLGRWYGQRSTTTEPAVMEGGAIVSNGLGLCVITDASLEDAEIAPEDRDSVERLMGHLGCTTLAVVPALEQEQTGHADVTVQFLAHDRVAVGWMAGTRHERNSRLLDRTAQVVSEAAQQVGMPLQVARVPMAAEGEVFYSYVNGTRVGDRFLVPHYDRVNAEFERVAHRVLAAHMPGVVLVPIPSDAVAERGGAVHCITLGIHLPVGHTHAACEPPSR